jgi:uncharacterized LabA/DUF88 family protein
MMGYTEIIQTKYKNYIEVLSKETALNAYLDLANMFHWQEVLGWRFRIEDVIKQLFSLPNVKEVKVYYGLNERDKVNSEVFQNRIRKTGALLRTKPVKFIRKTVNEALFFKKPTLTLFDGEIKRKIYELIKAIQESGIVIEEPKCNFDVEITLDMMDDAEKITGVILFSGDSDLSAPLERLKVKGKRIYIVGVRGMVSAELHHIKDMYIDFGKFYQGKRNYIKSENPAFGGAA